MPTSSSNTSAFLVSINQTNPNQPWLFHYGEVHYTFKREMFEDDFEEVNIGLQAWASGFNVGRLPDPITATHTARGMGTVKLYAQASDGMTTVLTLRNVYYVPTCGISGISLNRLLVSDLDYRVTQSQYGEGLEFMMPFPQGRFVNFSAPRHAVLVARPTSGKTSAVSLLLADVNDDDMAGLQGTFAMSMKKDDHDGEDDKENTEEMLAVCGFAIDA